MQNRCMQKIGVALLFLCGLQNISAAQAAPAQVQALSDQIPEGATVREVAMELIRRIHEDTVTVEYLQTCLDFGVDPNTRFGVDGPTFLMAAAFRANVPVVRILLEHGADACLVDSRYQCTAFHDVSLVASVSELSSNDLIATMDLLYKSGADLNHQNIFGNTALHNAWHNCEVVSYLVQNNANLDIQNEDGQSALTLAASTTEWGGPPDKYITVLKILLKAGADPNLQFQYFDGGSRGTTALMHAAEHRHPETLNCLIRAGADPFIRDFKGNTALDLARDDRTRRLLKEYESSILQRRARAHRVRAALQKPGHGSVSEMFTEPGPTVAEKCLKITATDGAGQIATQACIIS